MQSLKRPECVHLNKLMMRSIGSGVFDFRRLDRLLDLYMDRYDEILDLDSVESDEQKQMGMSSRGSEELYKYPYKQLLIWSVLTLK